MKPVHNRSNQWDGLPFAALEDVADFADALTAIVQELGAKAECLIDVECSDRDYPGLDTADLRALSSELPLEAVARLMLLTAAREEEPVRATLTLYGPASPMLLTRLRLEGSALGAVEGANVQAKQAIEKRFEQLRAAKKTATGKADTTARSAWGRVLNHPWAVQVGGGVAAGVIVAGVLLLLHWP